MSKDKNGNPNTLVSLKDYFDGKLEDFEEKTELQFKMSQLAVDKALIQNDIRLAGMNEFRDSLRDQAATFVTRQELNLMIKSITDKIEGQQRFMYMTMGGLAVLQFLLHFIQ
jgi:hypothetical protein